MKIIIALFLIGLFANDVARGQVIIADNYNVAGNGTGFALNAGVNSGINPPTTRLTGTAATNLRYMLTTTTKTNTAFSVTGSKLRVTSAANPGRFTLSANGTTPFNFASALGAGTPQNPVVYDLSISMANSSAGTQRFFFALGASEGDANTWDFGIALFRTASVDNFYTIGKRIDTAASGLAADLNTFITNTALGTFGTEINLLMRVTDAGSETTTFNSRVQLSLDGGITWFYDTESDPDLPNGWRLNGAGRYILWDIAPDAGPGTYDNFSISPVPVSATPVSPPNNASNIGATPTLKVAVSNAAPGNMTVTFFGREVGKPYPGRDFLIPVMPDTQNYAKADGAVNAHEMWYSQTEWIVTNRVQQNIVYVAQLGDVVQNGDVLNGSPNLAEWKIATNAMYRLENPVRTLLQHGIPYGCCVGNHDQEPTGDEDGSTTHFNQYFGTAHFGGKPYYGGHYDANGDNFFNLFSVGGLDFIVFSYEFNRYGSGVLNWTQSVLATNQNRRIIVMTHYAGNDCGGSSCSFSAGGQAIYDGLKSNTNFFLMLGGHVSAGAGSGEGRRSDIFNGRTVHTLVSDYQNRTAGGNGLMRLMYFSPSNNTVSVKTYSTWTKTYETDANSQFSFSYNMQLPTGPGTPGTPFAALGTNVDVVPGSQTSFAWSSRQANKTYEWYAKVTDSAGNMLFSSPRRFTTIANTAPVANSQTVTFTGDQAKQFTLQSFDANGDALTFRTNSRPAQGLITSFNSTNGAVTYLPNHGYNGTDQLTFQVNDSFATSSVATITLNVIKPSDANSNCIADYWETKYSVIDPNADPDGDGQNNLAEYSANTNPTNAASALKIVGATSQNGNVTLTWSSVGGTRYRIQHAAEINGVFNDIARDVVSETDAAAYGEASTQSFANAVSPTNSAQFYRIKIVP